MLWKIFPVRRKKKFYLIAESDLNDRRIVLDSQREGYRIDSQWSDDFHHAIHAVLTKENAGYYKDFGSMEQIAKVMKEGFVYTGELFIFSVNDLTAIPRQIFYRRDVSSVCKIMIKSVIVLKRTVSPAWFLSTH